MAVKTYVVTVPAGIGGGFYIDGVQKPTLDLAKGATYRFDVSDASNSVHPFRFSTNANNSPSSPYTTGVTTSGTQGNPGAYVEIDLTSTSTDTLYYYCTNHSGMGGQLNLTADSWGALSWNVGSWGEQDNINLTISGTQLTSNLGNETIVAEINSGWGRNNWDDLAWGVNYGNAIAILNGIQLSTNIGSVSISGQLNTGWGSDTWGTETWGISGLDIQLTGIGLSVSLSSVTTQSDVDDFTVTGQQATVVAGTGTEASSQLIQQVTGLPMGMTLQFEEVFINVTGFGLTMQEGDETATPNTIAEVSSLSPVTWGNSAWGYGVYGNQPVTTLAMSMQEGDLDPAPDVALTGNAAAMFLGEETITGDANLDLTGISLTFTLGTAVGDANTIASPSGILLSMQEGDEGTTANARVTPTGIALTMSIGTVYNLIWNEVNTGTTSTWTEVDTAA